jgi:hypothetical protein
MDSQSCARYAIRATHLCAQSTQKSGATRRPPRSIRSLAQLDGWPSGDEAPHDRDYREHEQKVNQAADVKDQEAEQPKYE